MTKARLADAPRERAEGCILPQKPLMRLGPVTGKVSIAAAKDLAGPTPESRIEALP
jgi:hypothetical protein